MAIELRINPTSIVDCSGTPPTFFAGWTYPSDEQLFNLYKKGALDMQTVAAVQAPSQAKGYARLDVIQRELKDREFIGAHVAEWYRRPENKAAFLEVCPSGYLVFLEKYRAAGRYLRAAYLCVHAGQVRVVSCDANDDAVFDAEGRFAVLGA